MFVFTCVKGSTAGCLVAVRRAVIDGVSGLSLNHARAVDVVRQGRRHLSVNRENGVLHSLAVPRLVPWDGVWFGEQCVDGEGFPGARFGRRHIAWSASIEGPSRAHGIRADGSKRSGRNLHCCWTKVKTFRKKVVKSKLMVRAWCSQEMLLSSGAVGEWCFCVQAGRFLCPPEHRGVNRPPSRLCLSNEQMRETSNATRYPINWWSCNRLGLSNILIALSMTRTKEEAQWPLRGLWGAGGQDLLQIPAWIFSTVVIMTAASALMSANHLIPRFGNQRLPLDARHSGTNSIASTDKTKGKKTSLKPTVGLVASVLIKTSQF